MKRQDQGRFSAAKRSIFRDPRFLVGLALIIISALLGAWIIDRATRVTYYFAADRDLAAGQVVTNQDFRLVPAQLPPGANYESGEAKELQGILSRSLRAGELLPRESVSNTSQRMQTLVLRLSEALPESAHIGDVMELWALPKSKLIGSDDQQERPQPEIIARNLILRKLAATQNSYAPQSQFSVEVAVPQEAVSAVMSEVSRRPLALINQVDTRE